MGQKVAGGNLLISLLGNAMMRVVLAMCSRRVLAKGEALMAARGCKNLLTKEAICHSISKFALYDLWY